MIEFDWRCDLKDSLSFINNNQLHYLIRTYKANLNEIPILDTKENCRIFYKIEFDIRNVNFSRTNFANILKTNKTVNTYDFISVLANFDDIPIVKTYGAQIYKFDLTEKHNFKPGPIRDLLFEHKKFIEIPFKQFLLNQESFIFNLLQLLEITKGRRLIFSSEGENIFEYKSFVEKFSVVMLSALDTKGNYLIKPFYKNQLEMENYHIDMFFEMIDQKCVENGVIQEGKDPLSDFLIFERIKPRFE